MAQPSDLSSAEALRQLYDQFLKDVPSEEWWKNLTPFFEMIEHASETERASLEFQQKLWEDNPVSAAGQVFISVDKAIEQREVRNWIASKSLERLPENPKEATARLAKLTDQMVERLRPYCPRIPYLKIFPVLTAFFPQHFATIADKGNLRDLHQAMFGSFGAPWPPQFQTTAGRAVKRHANVLARLTDVLGPMNADTTALVRRTTFPWFLYEKLHSSTGRRVLGRFIKGASIPHISANDLAQVSVVPPDLAVQSAIAKDALELSQTVSALESLVAEGKQSLKQNIFGLASAKTKFQNVSESTEKAFYQTLPFPIAVVYRKIANAPNNTQKFSSLIDLFEVAVRFIVLVQLADYVNNRRQASLVAQQIPAVKKLYGPSLGDWVNMFGAFANIKSGTESNPFLVEIKNFKLNKYQSTLQEFVGIRNASLRGHGATLTEDEYELRYQEHAPKVYELISCLGFLANYTLVKTGTMEKDGDFYKIAVQLLRGDNPHFEQSSILLRTPLDTNRVLYLNRQQESLVLDPYIVLERCPECRRPEVLLFDSFSEKKVTYLGYESGHRPALANAERMPAVIRELARRNP